MSDIERALIIEDDERVASLLCRVLEREDFEVVVASDGDSGLESAFAGRFDVIVLDRRLPGVDGLEVVRSLREREDRTPVLILTGRSGVTDRVEGLRAGADDYLAKPFAVEELLARVHALLRRSSTSHDAATLDVNGLHMNLVGREVTRAGESIELSPREFALLELLMRHPGHVMSRARLYTGAWKDETDLRSNTVDVYIGYLRDKIDRPFDIQSIETIRGQGYRLRTAREPAR